MLSLLTLGALGILVLNLLISICLTIDNLATSEGVNRLTWLLAIWIPIAGPLAYLFIGKKEQKQLKTPHLPWATEEITPQPTPREQQTSVHPNHKPVRWKDI